MFSIEVTRSLAPSTAIATGHTLISLMAFTELSSLLLLVLFLVGVTSSATGARYFPQIDCSPATTSNSSNDMAFRADLLALPADIPAQAAATRFASTQAGGGAGGGDDHEFARGVCLGDSAPAQYRESLAAAVADVVTGCGAASPRAGAWLDGCYLAYADTNTMSPSGSEFHRWLVTGDILPFSDNLYATFLDKSNGVAGRMLATQAIDVGATTRLAGRALAQCATDIAPADCVQCLEGAAGAMPRCFRDARREQGEGVAVVVSYDCVLRFDMMLAPS